nr:hypothetical protein GCM10020241_26420 [Streptoalloteichus tenebrarius]
MSDDHHPGAGNAEDLRSASLPGAAGGAVGDPSPVVLAGSCHWPRGGAELNASPSGYTGSGVSTVVSRQTAVSRAGRPEPVRLRTRDGVTEERAA